MDTIAIIIALLILIKEMNWQLNQLSNRLSMLEQRIAKLENRINSIGTVWPDDHSIITYVDLQEIDRATGE